MFFCFVFWWKRCNGLYFFFSSRGRHTRSKRDWSADVCSSDLGAALRVEGGEVISAVNVENASYGMTICAERAAVAAAVAAGHRRFEAVAVAADGTEPASACGACRQVLREFPNGPDLRVLLAGETGDELVVTTLGELLPGGFGPERLARGPGA